MMNTLLELKDRIQAYYTTSSVFIDKGIQFIFGFLVFYGIQSQVGFLKPAASPFVTVAAAVLCAFLPLQAMTALAAVLVLVHLYGLSLFVLGGAAALFAVIYIFYVRFFPGKSWVILFVVLMMSYRLPIVVPVALGLLASLGSAAGALSGVLVYYFLAIVKQSATAIKTGESAGMVADFTSLFKRFLSNREMWIMTLIVVAGILIVHTVRTRAVAHSWKVACASGVIVSVIICAAGNVAMDTHISYGMIFLSSVAALVLGLILELMFFTVDYKGVQVTQFEDDEYVYYVKAVPKVGVSVPSKKVQKIVANSTGVHSQQDMNDREREERDGSGEDSATAVIPSADDIVAITRESEDDLVLTRSLSTQLGLDDKK